MVYVLPSLQLQKRINFQSISRPRQVLHYILELVKGRPVNLERALLLSSRLAGHLVSGHIDGIGKIEDITDKGRSICVQVSAPTTLMKYIAHKGAICVDGVSLTVNDCVDTVFAVNIIPYTFRETLFSSYKIGTKVNLEVDLIARYLESLLRR